MVGLVGLVGLVGFWVLNWIILFKRREPVEFGGKGARLSSRPWYVAGSDGVNDVKLGSDPRNLLLIL